jgi:hypothetical protein
MLAPSQTAATCCVFLAPSAPAVVVLIGHDPTTIMSANYACPAQLPSLGTRVCVAHAPLANTRMLLELSAATCAILVTGARRVRQLRSSVTLGTSRMNVANQHAINAGLDLGAQQDPVRKKSAAVVPFQTRTGALATCVHKESIRIAQVKLAVWIALVVTIVSLDLLIQQTVVLPLKPQMTA